MTGTVFIVDDDCAVRDSLGSLLEAAGFDVIRYASAEDFLANYHPSCAGCLITDVAMPGMSGIELVETLTQRGIQLPIMVLTAYGDVPMSVQAMKAGAFDFFEKPVHGAALILRVNEALLRDRQQRDNNAAVVAAREKLHRLTAREREVMMLAVGGHHNKTIARRLGISHRTVELHRSRVMRKLGATSLLELANIAATADSAIPESATLASDGPSFDPHARRMKME